MVRSWIAAMATPRKSPPWHPDDDTPVKCGAKRPLDAGDDSYLASDHAEEELKAYLKVKLKNKAAKYIGGCLMKPDTEKEDELFLAWLLKEGGIMAKLTQVSIEDPEFATAEQKEMLARLLTHNPSPPLGNLLDDAEMREQPNILVLTLHVGEPDPKGYADVVATNMGGDEVAHIRTNFDNDVGALRTAVREQLDDRTQPVSFMLPDGSVLNDESALLAEAISARHSEKKQRKSDLAASSHTVDWNIFHAE